MQVRPELRDTSIRCCRGRFPSIGLGAAGPGFTRSPGTPMVPHVLPANVKARPVDITSRFDYVCGARVSARSI